MGVRVYNDELRESRIDREDQLEIMDDRADYVKKELQEKVNAVKIAQQELNDYEAWVVSRDDFRRKLIESLK